MSESLSELLAPQDLAPALVRVSPDSIRARRAWRTLLLLFAWQAVSGVMLMWPLETFVRRSLATLPDGDAGLFSRDGLLLTSLTMKPAWDAVVITQLALGLGLLWIVGRFVFAMLVGSLSFARRDASHARTIDLVPVAFGAFWPSVTICILASILQGLFLLLGFLLGTSASAISTRYGDAAGDQAMLFVVAFFALGALLVGVLEDAALCAVVRWRMRALDAYGAAFRAIRSRPLEMLWAWGWRTAASLALLAIGAEVASKLGGKTGTALLTLALCHQAIVVARLLLRAAWLSKALRVLRAR